MNYLDEGGVTKVAKLVKQGYVAKENGKGLSSNDFTDALKTKLENLTSVFRFKGIVATVNDLPTTADDGDIYGVGTAQTGFEGYIYFTGTWHEWEQIRQNDIDYNILQNKPSIGGVALEGNKTPTELNLVDGPTFTTALDNKLDLPTNSGTAGTVLINNADGTYEWGSIGGGLTAGSQTINGIVTINVTSSSGIACWILNRNNTTAGFIELKYSNTRVCVIGKGGSSSNTIMFSTYANYGLSIAAQGALLLEGSSITLSRLPVCTATPTSDTCLIRKIDVKNIVAASTDFNDFKTRIANW